MSKYLRPLIALSIFPQILFVKILAKFPNIIESYYSNGLYIFISQMMRNVFGWIPFSIGDIFYTLLGIYIFRWLIINRKRLKYEFKSYLTDVFIAISIAYFAFHILWAFNYYRVPLHHSLQLKRDYDTQSLIDVTQNLINKTNELQLKISKNDTIKVTMPFTKAQLLTGISLGFESLEREYPNLEYHPQSVKRSLYSYPLTYMGFSGYLNPFTNEAHIDGLIPLYKYPTTASHEIAHQLGYAAENEANFIGGLAAMRHPEIHYRYSGYSFALGHCLNEILLRDPMLHEVLLGTINKGILKNYQEMNLFWLSFQNPAEPYFKSNYNNFLKANNQSMGMESYNYVVALLVNYFEKHDL